MQNRIFLVAAITVIGILAGNGITWTQSKLVSAEQPTSILINNARIFDGVSDELRPGNLLIVATKIKQISSARIIPPEGAQVIDGGGRVLMPA